MKLILPKTDERIYQPFTNWMPSSKCLGTPYATEGIGIWINHFLYKDIRFPDTGAEDHQRVLKR